MIALLKILQVILMASVKYFFTIPYALLIGLDFKQTLLYVTLGGIAGFFFFYYLSGFISGMMDRIRPLVCRYLPNFVRAEYHALCNFVSKYKSKKVFSRKSRFIVNFRNRFGLWGILIASPIVLSIPVGAYLLNRYYSNHKFVYPYMVLSILSWSAVFSTLALIFPHLVA